MENVNKFELTDDAILELIKYGTLTKEVKINKDVTVYIKNLTQEDRENFTKEIKVNKSGNSDDMDASLYSIMEMSKIPLLIQIISKINNIEFNTPEKKQQLQVLLKQLPSAVIDKIYAAHLDNESEFISTLQNEEVKKN